VKLHGGSPANFLDVGGGVTVDRVSEAMRILNTDVNVNSILVNIFGGIARCDIIVEGLIKAVRKYSITKPIVLRLKGTNEDIAEKLIRDSGLKLVWSDTLEQATKTAVQLSSL
jgi:succinyl-CoA synthetase beta subunit